MIKCLRAYDFPESYINNIKLIYNDLSASVMINGYTTNRFKIERSVKQGDALSCALFVICIDPLLRAIENDNDIKATRLFSDLNQNEPKTLSYADDITIIVSTEESIHRTIAKYESFAKTSGITLNIEKTEILIAGVANQEKEKDIKVTYANKDNIIRSQKEVKICGVVFGSDTDTCYKENIKKQISKLERKLNFWRSRNLSLIGKILIVKTFGLSQIIFQIQQNYISYQDMTEIDNIINKFIWNKKSESRATGLISKTQLKSTYQKGGLNSPDIYTLNLGLKYKNLIRSLNTRHPISSVYTYLLNQYNFSFDYDPYLSKKEAEKNRKES